MKTPYAYLAPLVDKLEAESVCRFLDKEPTQQDAEEASEFTRTFIEAHGWTIEEYLEAMIKDVDDHKRWCDIMEKINGNKDGRATS